jgi:PIN domain nuclease of toxin-antitoxin system
VSFLLDTHSFLWAAINPARLSSAVRAILVDPENEINVSALSFWEISLKYALGKLALNNISPDDLPKLAATMSIGVLPFDAVDAASVHWLPMGSHKDPFDRMLVWQCIRRQWTLVSVDKALRLYERAGLKLVR